MAVFEPRGLVAHTYATIRARDGVWPTTFLRMLAKGQVAPETEVPGHIRELAEEYARTRPWEREEEESDVRE